jgi:hypothetical protein
VSACTPTTRKYQSGACDPPPNLGPSYGIMLKISSDSARAPNRMISGIQM